MMAIIEWLNRCSIRAVTLGVAGCVFLFTWGLDTHGTFAGSGDEPHYAMIAQSLAFDGDLDLANNYADRSNLVGAGGLSAEAHAISGVGGVLRPVHDIGLPVLFAPYFGLAYRLAERSPWWIPPRLMTRARLNPPLVLRHLLSLAMIVVTAALAAWLFLTCRRLCGTNTAAAFWTVLFVVSPPILAHSFLFFSEIPSAFIVAAFAWELVDSDWRSRWRTSAAGCAVGYLLLLHIRNAGLVVGMIAVFLWRVRRRIVSPRQVPWFMLPIAGMVAARTAINVRFWGSLVTTPHARFASGGTITGTGEEAVTRAFGLLTDQAHGLLPYAPIYALLLPGVWLAFRDDRGTMKELAFLAAAYLVPVLLPFVNPHGWEGGWSPAARFLVPIAPLMVLLAFEYLRRLPLHRVPRAVVALAAMQVAANALYWSHPKLLWNDVASESALAVFLSFGTTLCAVVAGVAQSDHVHGDHQHGVHGGVGRVVGPGGGLSGKGVTS